MITRKPLLGVLFITSILVFLGACSDPAGLLPRISRGVEQGVVFSLAGVQVRDGAVLGANSRLQLSLRNPGDQDTRIRRAEFLLLDDQMQALEELKTLEGVLEETLGSQEIVLPPLLSPGMYLVEYSLFQDEGDLEPFRTGYLTFFSLSQDQLPIISSVSSYPSAFIAGGMGMLEARVTLPETYPDDFRPYFRWTQDGEVLGEGTGVPIEQGFQQVITVRSPDKSGIYSAQVEVFPMVPPDEGGFSFSAPITQQVEVVVSSSAAVTEGVHDSRDFLFLLPFSGTLDIIGDRSPEISSTKELLPGLRNQTFGYEFLPDRWIELAEFLLPVNSEGALHNHTFLADLVLDFLPLERGVEVFSTRTAGTGLEYRVEITPQGALGLEFITPGGSQGVFTPGGVIQESELAQIGISVYALEPSRYGILLLVNGVIYASGEIQVPNLGAGTIPGTTVIGKNLSGILDELGISFKRGDTVGVVADGLFTRYMEKTYGDSLEYAMGFEAGRIPQGLTVSDGVHVEPGALILPPGTWITLPKSTFESKAMTFALASLPMEDPGQNRLEIHWNDDPDTLVQVSFDGTTVVTRDSSTTVLGYLEQGISPAGLSLNVSAVDGALLLGSEEEPLRISLGETPIQSLSFKIERVQEAEGDLSLQNLLAVRNGRPIIQDIIQSLQ